LYFPFKKNEKCMKKYLAEFIGTLFFVLTILMAAHNGSSTMMPVAAGVVLIGFSLAMGSVSGAHFNPAISLAAFMRGMIDRTDFLYYVVAQIVGALLAATLASFLLSCAGGLELRPVQHQWICALLAELLGALALVFVWLQTQHATDKTNLTIALAPGLTLIAVAYSLGDLINWTYNPALAIGMALLDTMPIQDIWIYWVGPLVGGAIAASLFQVFNGPSEI
jgi:aquaporin Z